jgi:uncharacterized membrane protein
MKTYLKQILERFNKAQRSLLLLLVIIIIIGSSAIGSDIVDDPAADVVITLVTFGVCGLVGWLMISWMDEV